MGMDTLGGSRAAVEGAEIELRRAWDDVIRWLRGRKSIDAIAKLIAEGRLTEIVTDDDLRRAGDALAGESWKHYRDAADQVAGYIGDELDTLIVYDQTDRLAVKRMEENRLRMVGGFTAEQRDVVRAVLVDQVRDSVNPRVAARAIRGSIGLTPTQLEHVGNYRRALEGGDIGNALGRELRDARSDRTLEAVAAGKKSLSPTQIDTMVDRYRENYIDYRAEVIARKESMRAVHEGNADAWAQAERRGEVQADQMVQQWHAASGPRTRDSHRAMNGQRVKLGEAFTTGAGISIRYPGDPDAPIEETAQCRCSVSRRFVA